MKKVRILLTGGGSGGHIYPLIAVVQKLKQFSTKAGTTELDLRYFGDAGGYEGLLISSGVKYKNVVSSKFRRYFSFKNFVDFFKFFFAFFQSIWKVFWFMPDTVFSKGGPGSLPVVFACKFFGVPIVVHDSDSVPGLTNLISGKLAKKIFLAFDSAAKYFLGKNVEVVGNPVRNELIVGESAASPAKITDVDIRESKLEFGFNPKLPVLLILGGSQGAAAINDFVIKNIETLATKFQILHQTGRGNFDEFKADYEFLAKTLSDAVKNNYKFVPYFDNDLKYAYIAADLVLARSSAGTIFELAYFGKPAILVPLPDAANDHQQLNAIELEKAGVSITIDQENFLSHLVIAQLESLISKPAVMEKMSAAASAFYKPFSADKIAAYLLSLGGIDIYKSK